jgi:hypothetical protein
MSISSLPTLTGLDGGFDHRLGRADEGDDRAVGGLAGVHVEQRTPSTLSTAAVIAFMTLSSRPSLKLGTHSMSRCIVARLAEGDRAGTARGNQGRAA